MQRNVGPVKGPAASAAPALTDSGLLKARSQIADICDVLSRSPEMRLQPAAVRKLRQAAAFLGVAMDLLDDIYPLEPIDLS
jgi:hypothetical protein